MSFIAKMLDNAKTFTATKDSWKDVGMAVGGAVTYPLYATILNSWFKWDMRSWKGASVGLFTNAIVSFALGSPGWFIGTIAGFCLHFSYARLNEWVVYPVFGQYLFEWNPEVYQTMSDCPNCGCNNQLSDDMPESEHEQLQPGAKWVEIGGRKVQVFDKSDVDIQVPRNLENQTSATLKGFRSSVIPTNVEKMPIKEGVGGFRKSGMSGFRRTTISGIENSAMESSVMG